MPELTVVMDKTRIDALHRISYKHRISATVGNAFGNAGDKFWLTLEYVEPKDLLELGIDLGSAETAGSFVDALIKSVQKKGGQANG